MATTPPKGIDKGHLLRDTDKVLTRTAEYQQRLDELRKRSLSLVEIAAQQNVINTTADRTHAERETLGGGKDPMAWWPQIEDKEEILREGFIKAYELALQDPSDVKPIETYWIPGWSSFAVAAIAGPGPLISLLILTPPPPPGRLVGTIDQDMYVVSNEKAIDGILDGYRNRAEAEKNVTRTSCPGVQVFRVKGA